MKKNILLLTLAMTSLNALSQVTFSEHIAPIIYDHCTKCHREGEIGPMPLTNYAEVSANGSIIEYVTDIRYMPPWRPDHTYSTLRDENVLTDDQIDMIAEWVQNGMPQGDPNLEPPLPVFPEGSQIGVPDLVIQMEQPYQHLGTNSDQYQIFVLPTGLTEDKDVEAIEVRADNNTICHHAILGVDTSGTAAQLDAQDPEYGYTQFGGFGFNPVDDFFTAWVPGASPLVYPPTIGKKLYAGSDLLLQMHYGPTPIDQYDQTEVNIFYADDPIQRYVITYPISPVNLDQAFIIPPNQVKTFHGTVDIDFDISVIGVAPHAHLLGKSYEVYAVSENLQDTINIIKIPEWNFNWQGLYAFPSLLHIPAGYTVHCIGVFDNTSANPLNPNDPPQWVTWGENTADEMYLCYVQFVAYQNGDENISLAAANDADMMAYPTTQLFPSYPNPTNDEFTIGFSLKDSERVTVQLFDQQGRLIRTLLSDRNYAPGRHKVDIDVRDLSSGMYVYRVSAGEFSGTGRMIVEK